MPDKRNLLTVREAAEYLNISRDLLYKYSNPRTRPEDCTVPMPTRIGAKMLFQRRDLDAYLSKSSVTTRRKDPELDRLAEECADSLRMDKVSAVKFALKFFVEVAGPAEHLMMLESGNDDRERNLSLELTNLRNEILRGLQRSIEYEKADLQRVKDNFGIDQ